MLKTPKMGQSGVSCVILKAAGSRIDLKRCYLHSSDRIFCAEAEQVRLVAFIDR